MQKNRAFKKCHARGKFIFSQSMGSKFYHFLIKQRISAKRIVYLKNISREKKFIQVVNFANFRGNNTVFLQKRKNNRAFKKY